MAKIVIPQGTLVHVQLDVAAYTRPAKKWMCFFHTLATKRESLWLESVSTTNRQHLINTLSKKLQWEALIHQAPIALPQCVCGTKPALNWMQALARLGRKRERHWVYPSVSIIYP